MSIQTQINRIKSNIISALQKVADKGVTVPADSNSDDLSDLIEHIKADPNLQSKTVTPTTSKQEVTADSGYDGLEKVTVNAMPAATQATPSIAVSTLGMITASATQTAGYVSAGTKSATKQLTTQAAQTITPGTSDKTIASGRYLTGVQTIKGDANLVPENIVGGKSIFGVAGTAEVGGGSGGNYDTCTITVYLDSGATRADINYLYIDEGKLSLGFAQIATTTESSHTFTALCNSLIFITQFKAAFNAYDASGFQNDSNANELTYLEEGGFITPSANGATATLRLYDDD